MPQLGIDGLDDDAIRDILTRTRRIALVGASANPARASHGVLGFLLARGYDVTPVNPGLVGQSLHGTAVVGRLDAATPLELVDIFRASAEAGAVCDDAVRLGARVVWMQLGVVDQAAADRARQQGVCVVMDRCPIIESARLGLADHPA